MQTLEDLRNQTGMSQAELAKVFGVSDRTIYSVEKDSSNISNALLEKYLVGFGVRYDDIFLGKKYVENVRKKERLLDNLQKTN